MAGVGSGTILQLENCRQERYLRSEFETGCSLKVDLEFYRVQLLAVSAVGTEGVLEVRFLERGSNLLLILIISDPGRWMEPLWFRGRLNVAG